MLLEIPLATTKDEPSAIYSKFCTFLSENSYSWNRQITQSCINKRVVERIKRSVSRNSIIMTSTSFTLFVVCFAAATSFTLVRYEAVKPSPAANVVVTLNKSSATVATGATAQFSASVINTTNGTVIWSVDTVVGGSTILGTINPSGLYAAPIDAGVHVVTATSAAASSASASATVTVSNRSSISPAPINVNIGNRHQLNP
jgi:hypothetical protein